MFNICIPDPAIVQRNFKLQFGGKFKHPYLRSTINMGGTLSGDKTLKSVPTLIIKQRIITSTKSGFSNEIHATSYASLQLKGL